LRRIEIRRVAPTNKEATRPLRNKKYQGVVSDITINPKNIPIGENIVSQFHLLS